MIRMSKYMVKIFKGALLGKTFLALLGEGERSREIDQSWTAQQKYRQKKRLEQLSVDGYIILGGERVLLTNKGRALLSQIQHEEVNIAKEAWDGVWHIVSYDIPDKKKKARDAFRRQLIKWDFYQTQESVWVLPYSCKEEVSVIAQDYGIAPYVLYMNAVDLPMAEKLRRQFQL